MSTDAGLASKWERRGECAHADEIRAALGEPGNVRVSSTRLVAEREAGR